MNKETPALKREDILNLAHQAKLMVEDGGMYYLNDIATDKELLTFARLIQSALQQSELPH